MGYGDWTQEQVLKVIACAKIKGDSSIALDFEHATWENQENMFYTIRSYGWEAENKMESIVVRNLQTKPGRI